MNTRGAFEIDFGMAVAFAVIMLVVLIAILVLVQHGGLNILRGTRWFA